MSTFLSGTFFQGICWHFFSAEVTGNLLLWSGFLFLVLLFLSFYVFQFLKSLTATCICVVLCRFFGLFKGISTLHEKVVERLKTLPKLANVWQRHNLNAFWLLMSWGELIWSSNVKSYLNSDDSQICISSPDFSPEVRTCTYNCSLFLLTLPLLLSNPLLLPSPCFLFFPFPSPLLLMSILMISQTWLHSKEDPYWPYAYLVSLKVFSILANGNVSHLFAQAKSWNNHVCLFLKLDIETECDLWGSWAWKLISVPHFLFVRNRVQPPWPSLSSKGQVQTAANQGREGRGDKGGAVKKQ